MKRLAIYAHYSSFPQVAGHVLFCLQHLMELGFQICFVSNSELSLASEAALNKFCARIIVRENTGLDFGMWQRALAGYDLSQLDELLLTNSSIIGPVQPLAPIWQHPAVASCDFWGLTDNEELNRHLQSYFLVFRRQVIQSPRFAEFWRSVLPYKDRQQVIFSYELGLSQWLEEGGFNWRAVYPQREIWRQFLRQRGWVRNTIELPLERNMKKPRNTTLYAPDILLQSGMPFIKAELLKGFFSQAQSNGRRTVAWLKSARLPAEIQEALSPLLR